MVRSGDASGRDLEDPLAGGFDRATEGEQLILGGVGAGNWLAVEGAVGDGSDAVAVDCDVGCEWLAPRAIDHEAVPNHQIEDARTPEMRCSE